MKLRDETIGLLAVAAGGSFFFGLWMRSFSAGCFMFCVLLIMGEPNR